MLLEEYIEKCPDMIFVRPGETADETLMNVLECGSVLAPNGIDIDRMSWPHKLEAALGFLRIFAEHLEELELDILVDALDSNDIAGIPSPLEALRKLDIRRAQRFAQVEMQLLRIRHMKRQLYPLAMSLLQKYEERHALDDPGETKRGEDDQGDAPSPAAPLGDPAPVHQA